MRQITVCDTRGNKVEISEDQLARHYKKSLITLWSELGNDPMTLARYDDDLYRVVGAMVATIRELRSSLEHAEKRLKKAEFEFRKLRDERLDDLDTIKRLVRRQERFEEHDIEPGENVVELRRKAA